MTDPMPNERLLELSALASSGRIQYVRAGMRELVEEVRRMRAREAALVAALQKPSITVTDEGSTLVEWFLPDARLLVAIEGPVPPQSGWSYVTKEPATMTSGALVRDGEATAGDGEP